MAPAKTRHITILIDRSGSMSNIQDATQEGLNGFLAQQAKESKETGVRTLVTLYHFDDVFEAVYEGVPIKEVRPYELEPRNSTALLDALAETFKRARARRKALPKDQRPDIEHYLIVTDGMENSSTTYRGRYTDVAEIVRTEAARKGRVVQYMGANQDAIAEASKIGIAATNAMSYSYNSVGTQGAWEGATASASAGLSGGSYDFTPQMRAKAMAEPPRKHPATFPPASGKGASLVNEDALAGLVDKRQEDEEE